MELVKINAKDDKIIYSLYNKSKNSKKLVVLVHGLEDSYCSYIISRSLEVFADNGFDAIAINLYDWKKGARKSVKTTIIDNASDISSVVEYYRKEYEQIYLVGHSLGGIAIMVANLDNISAVSLWDPSFNIARYMKKKDYVSISDEFIWSGGSLIISKEFLEDLMSYDEKKCLNLSKDFKSKIQIITADGQENVFYNKDINSFHSKCRLDNERIYIKNADHNFIENNSYYELISSTINWFDKK